MTRVGQNHIYTVYIYCKFGGETTKYTITYGVYIHSLGQPYTWPNLSVFDTKTGYVINLVTQHL